MSRSRQRMLDAFAFNSPDRIPVVYHPSPAGLHVHGRKLVDLFNAYPPDNPVTFGAIPTPPAGTVDAAGYYHELRTDEWGTEWRHLIFGVHGHPNRYPFASWAQATAYQFPPPVAIDTAAIAAQRTEHLVFSGWVSIFEKLHALRPMDELLMDLATGDPWLMRFLDRLVEHWLIDIHRMLDGGVDVIMFADDWGTQQAPIISPAMFRHIFKPRYETMMAPVRRAKRKVFFHCCGCMRGILDELIDLGIDGLWPQLGLFEADPQNLEKCRDSRVSIYIHPDRQRLIPLGAPAEIDAAIRRYAERYRAQGGGGIFYVEIENDAPFANVETLVRSIDRWR